MPVTHTRNELMSQLIAAQRFGYLYTAGCRCEDEVSGYDDYDSSGGYHYTLDNPNNW